MRNSAEGADALTDAYSVLGVRPRAPIHEARAAWLRLVKELHPDTGFDDPIASEQLKAINQAYQTLKNPGQGETPWKTEPSTSRTARATFAIFLFLPVAAAVVIAGTRTYWSPSTTIQEEQKVGSSDPSAGLKQARDADEKRVSASLAHGPDDPGAARNHSDQAADDDAAWAIATAEGTTVSLHRYLGRYPQGRHAQRVMGDLAQIAAAEIALAKDYHVQDATAVQIAESTLGRYLLDYPTGRLANEARSKLAMLETGTAADRADLQSGNKAPLKDLDLHSSGIVESNVDRALAPLMVAEREQGEDDAAWSDAQRADTKGAFTGYLAVRPNGRHAQTARARVAEFERIIAAKPVTAAAIKTDKQRPRLARPSASVAHSGYRWPSADEPFVGADGRVR